MKQDGQAVPHLSHLAKYPLIIRDSNGEMRPIRLQKEEKIRGPRESGRETRMERGAGKGIDTFSVLLKGRGRRFSLVFVLFSFSLAREEDIYLNFRKKILFGPFSHLL